MIGIWKNVATDIIEKMLSDENIGVTLGKKDFVHDLLSLPRQMSGNENLKDKANYIIENVLLGNKNVKESVKSKLRNLLRRKETQQRVHKKTIILSIGVSYPINRVVLSSVFSWPSFI